MRDRTLPDSQIVIGEITRSQTEMLRVSLSHWKRADQIDIRICAKTPHGEIIPTKKGATVRPDDLLTLMALLERARLAALRRMPAEPLRKTG